MDWKAIVRLGLLYLRGAGKIKEEEAVALTQILSSGTAEEALMKLVEAWIAREMAEDNKGGTSRLSPKASKRLAELEARVALLEAAREQ